MSSRRLPVLTPDVLNDEQRALYESIAGSSRKSFMAMSDDDGGLVGPFNAYLYSPVIGELLQRLGAAIRASSHLTRRMQELAILVTAVDADSAFETMAHEQLALSAGLELEQVQTLLAGQEPQIEDPAEQMVWRTAMKLVEKGDLSDEEYDKAVSALGPEKVVDLTTLIGYYRLIALQLRLFRVPTP